MMVLDHVGDQEAMVYAQLGQQPLARTTVTSLEPRLGTLSCLSARPPDLATATAAQPEVACVRPSIVPFLHSKRTAVTRSPGSRYGRSIVLSPLRLYQPWTDPGGGGARVLRRGIQNYGVCLLRPGTLHGSWLGPGQQGP